MSEYDKSNGGWEVFGKLTLGTGVIAALGYGGYKGFTAIQQDSYESGFRVGKGNVEEATEAALEAKTEEWTKSGRLIDPNSCFRFTWVKPDSDSRTYTQVITCGNLELSVTEGRFSTLKEGDYEVTRGFKEDQWGRKTPEGFSVHKYKTEKVELK